MSKNDKPINSDSSENTKAGNRCLKVYYGSHHGSKYSRHPVIRLSGKYLRDFGFKIGDTIEVKLSDGRIEISKAITEKAPHS